MGDEAEFILSKFADDIKLGGVAVALGVWASWRIGEREDPGEVQQMENAKCCMWGGVTMHAGMCWGVGKFCREGCVDSGAQQADPSVGPCNSKGQQRAGLF